MIGNRGILEKTSRACLAGLALCVAAPQADAQQGRTTLDQLIADIGVPDINRREEAMRILAGDSTLTLRQLEERLRDPTLSPEQRCRLSQAARQRFMESPRPAMGVRFDLALPDRVAIDKVYDKFPAAGVLELGDIIVGCEGEKLPRSRAAWTRLGAHIFAHEPGDTIVVDVRRGAERIQLKITQGRLTDLNDNAQGQGARPDDERLERAWELRSSGLMPAATRPPIDPLIPAGAALNDFAPPDIPNRMARVKAQLNQPQYRPRVVIGGEPRGGELDIEELYQMNQPPNNNLRASALLNRTLQQQRLAQQGLIPGWSGRNDVTMTVEQEIATLEKARADRQRELDLVLNSTGFRPGDLAQREREIQARREALSRAKKQLEAVRAESGAQAPAAPAQVPPTPISDR